MSRRHTHTTPAPAQPTYAERLRHVSGLMDSLAEARLERVVRTARRLYGVEAASILLWRGQGLAFHVQAGEGGPGVEALFALARDVVRGGAPRVLAEGDPAVGRRFLALAPLAVDRGLSGGCLVLVDQRPRAFAPEDLQSLGDLVSWGEHELDVVRLGQALALRMA